PHSTKKRPQISRKHKRAPQAHIPRISDTHTRRPRTAKLDPPPRPAQRARPGCWMGLVGRLGRGRLRGGQVRSGGREARHLWGGQAHPVRRADVHIHVAICVHESRCAARRARRRERVHSGHPAAQGVHRLPELIQRRGLPGLIQRCGLAQLILGRRQAQFIALRRLAQLVDAAGRVAVRRVGGLPRRGGRRLRAGQLGAEERRARAFRFGFGPGGCF
ncbi:hypothetical protein BJ138DRAFT_728249, partial [Hygrophoropsis aurantiaca]